MSSCQPLYRVVRGQLRVPCCAVTSHILTLSESADSAAHLARVWAVSIPSYIDKRIASDWAKRVLSAKEHWTADFGGEQFSLGRAFYTHFEEGRSPDYFASAAESDALVERVVPGLQAGMLHLVAQATGGIVRRRRGWCGPGVHIFPAGEKVAREGGVQHFDTEGVPAFALEKRARALSAVLMLEDVMAGGGLRVWGATYSGCDQATDAEVAGESELVSYASGDAVLFDSYRLHQIQPFGGDAPRISATVHALEVSPNVWETWF